ncbi:MAG: dUTPase [Parcubacteria group bacterium Athens0714_26]|nr:MAG: dUTPase [Parcubacteria group bacterium Athens1014_26]TSD03582.1 MAG: dUTPase [Parcubacteria group bacterium Athens0714_26]
MKLKIKKLHQEAVVPKYAKKHDAGMDLFALEDHTASPGEVIFVKTGIAMEIPEGYVGLVWDKSGFSTKTKMKTLGGVIDAGYRGDVTVCLINLCSEAHHIEKGMKVAQILIQKVEQPEIELVEELSESERGEGGFGSTGKK